MKTILRNTLAVIIGLFVGGSVNMALVLLGPQLIPPPPGVNMGDAKSLAASAHLLEPKHYLFPFLAHAVGAFAGALTAHVIAGTRRAVFAYVVGGFFLLGGIMASFMIPAPAWFIALDLLVAYVPMAWLAARVGGSLRADAGGAANAG